MLAAVGGGSLRVDGIDWRIGRTADPDQTAEHIRAALAAVADGSARNVKDGRRKRLFPLALARRNPPDHLLKRNGYPWHRGVLRLPGRSKARRELAIATALAERQVPVVVPLAAGERRRGARLIECWLLNPVVDDVTDLRQLWSRSGLAPSTRHEVARAMGVLARRAHDAGLFQDDFAPNNVLVRLGPPAELWLIDFERAALRRTVGRKQRRWMLSKLDRALPGASASQRMRFLRGYTADDVAEARAWWRELADYAPRLAARDCARMRRTATTDGRRFCEVSLPAGRGFARRDVALEPIAAGTQSEDLPESGRIETADKLWRVQYPAGSAAEMRDLWARANTLYARSLGPRPLALLAQGRGWLLLSERPTGAEMLSSSPADADARAAVARLVHRLLAIGELVAPLSAEAVAVVPTGDEAAKALLLAPHGYRFSGRVGGPDQRADALTRLRTPPRPSD